MQLAGKCIAGGDAGSEIARREREREIRMESRAVRQREEKGSREGWTGAHTK